MYLNETKLKIISLTPFLKSIPFGLKTENKKQYNKETYSKLDRKLNLQSK